MALYPSLDYKGLYTSLLNFHDLVSQINQVTDSTIHDLNVCSPLMERKGNEVKCFSKLTLQGLYDFGKAYLNTLCALVPFLERELIDTLPYMCCSLLPIFPPSLSQG